jgi:LPS export ABC transporter protein LptC
LKNKIYFFVALILSISFIDITCTEFESEDSQATDKRDFPDQESWDAQMFFTKDGKRRAVLKSGYIAKYSNKKYTLLKEGVRVEFYDQQGNPKSVLTSDEGKVFDDRQDMLATGNVVLISKNGSHLYSDELLWDNKEEKIISTVAIKITTATDTLYGDTFKSDPDLINYEITNARGTSEKTITIDDK